MGPRRILLLASLIVFLAGSEVHGQLGQSAAHPSEAGLQAVLKAGEMLTKNPNRADLHLAVAKAYYQRGALQDVRRVYSHIKRATDLDPSQEKPAEKFLKKSMAGNYDQPLPEAAVAMDEAVKDTLPFATWSGTKEGSTASEAPDEADPNRHIAQGMAFRAINSRLRADRESSLAEVKKRLAKNYDWPMPAQDAPESQLDEVWRERLREIGSRPQPKGWEAAYKRALYAAVANSTSTESLRVIYGDEVFHQYGDIPSPMRLKDEAALAYHSGDLAGAINRLVTAVAASKKLIALKGEAGPRKESILIGANDEGGQQAERESYSALVSSANAQRGGIPAVFTAPPAPPVPRAPSAPLPPATAPTPQTGTGGDDKPKSSAKEAVAKLPDKVFNLERKSGDAALETLEALRNEEVPGKFTETKVNEMAAIGKTGSPLILDLNRNGKADVVGGLLPDGKVDPVANAPFDLDGDGEKECIDWLRPGADGLLAVDLDGDGVVGSGRELFGTAFGHADGFARLAVFDIDGDGWIKGREAAELRIWMDDGDGRCEPKEMRSLASFGITAISCRAVENEAVVRTRSGKILCWDWWPDIRY